MNLLYVIRQRRRLLWAAFLALAGAYLVYELVFAREYTAFAQVRAIHSAVAKDQDLDAYDQDFTAHVQLVQSAGFLEGMADGLSDEDRRQLLASDHNWFGPTETAGEVLLDRRIIAPNQTSQIIDLGFTHHDPKLAARMANALAAEFVRQSDAMNEDQKKKQLGDLQHDADTLSQKVDTLQAQMDGYLSKYGMEKLDPSETNADYSSLQELSRKAVDDKSALDKLDLERQQIQQEVLSGQPLWNLSFIAAQPHVQQLFSDLHDFLARLDQMRHEQYAEDSPPMMELKGRINNVSSELADAADVIAKQVSSDYDAAMTAASQSAKRLEDARKDALDLSTARKDYESLREEHDATQKLAAAKAVELSDQQSKLSLSMTTYALLAGAEPPASADPAPWMRFILHSIGAGALGSILLALGLAAFRPPAVEERKEHERRRRRHRHFHSSTRRR
jgi:polysaccharide biosynthesis transport protein